MDTADGNYGGGFHGTSVGSATPCRPQLPAWGLLPHPLSAALLAAGTGRDYAEFRIAIGGAALCPIHVDY
ncbi:hypothetical protein GCM10007175_04250 [Pseudarthrobacter scleromae]|uniref:Uncharacterized protein n=1 Tax=Pseudarthrobacter scleromae TaxID=158897 RepID=A0ABQ2CCN5_9MICC|nr:hypothetical protein GCM10007175_04250 [Pseudarthrobacter scleromae]